LAVEAQALVEAYRAEAERVQHHEGQDDQPDADMLTMCARDGPGGQKLVCVHRLS